MNVQLTRYDSTARKDTADMTEVLRAIHEWFQAGENRYPLNPGALIMPNSDRPISAVISAILERVKP